jgi:hypothetical protein
MAETEAESAVVSPLEVEEVPFLSPTKSTTNVIPGKGVSFKGGPVKDEPAAVPEEPVVVDPRSDLDIPHRKYIASCFLLLPLI